MCTVVYVGCRTSVERNARGKGLKVYQTDGEVWTEIQCIVDVENPSYQCIGEKNQLLYSVHGDIDQVSVFAISQSDGTLNCIQKVSGVGKNPVFISLNQQEDFLYVASLQGGQLTAFALNGDGTIKECMQTIRMDGTTPEHTSFAHQCLWDGTFDHLFVPTQSREIGFEQVKVFEKLQDHLREVYTYRTGGVNEPRHVAIHPNNQVVYLVNERGNNVQVLQFSPQTGVLTLLQTISTLPADYTGRGQASAILVHPSGKYVYASNRIHESIAAYAVNQTDGTLDLLDIFPCGGSTPRFITFSPDGDALWVANEDSDDIQFFNINVDGRLCASGGIKTESPVCMTFTTVGGQCV